MTPATRRAPPHTGRWGSAWKPWRAHGQRTGGHRCGGCRGGCKVRGSGGLLNKRGGEEEGRVEFGEVKAWLRGGKRGEDDGWDSRLRDATLVLLPIFLSRANSGKDGGMNY